MKPGDKVMLDDAVEFVCPFCKRKCQHGIHDGREALVHAVPRCKKFIDLEPEDFISQAVQRVKLTQN